MNIIALIVSIIGTLVVISGFVVAVWVTARGAGKDERIKRLLADSNDYKSRLEFVEPRLTKALEENQMLQELHNPTEAMAGIKSDTAGIKSDTAQILALLRAQAVELTEARDQANGRSHE